MCLAPTRLRLERRKFLPLLLLLFGGFLASSSFDFPEEKGRGLFAAPLPPTFFLPCAYLCQNGLAIFGAEATRYSTSPYEVQENKKGVYLLPF